MTPRRSGVDGRVVLITGAASGIGAAAAGVFGGEGAILALTDVDADGVAGVAAAVGATAYIADLSRSDQVDDLFARVLRDHGRIDAVLHVAGVDDPGVKALIAERAAEKMPLDITVGLTDEQWHRLIAIDLTAAFFVTRAALRHMTPRRSGSIAHVASIAGVDGFAGLPHYSAAKAGLIGLVRSVAKEVRDRGVRVNAVAPGGVDTPMVRRNPGRSEWTPPMGRLATAEEIAAALLYLTSDDAGYITGEVININGGALTV